MYKLHNNAKGSPTDSEPHQLYYCIKLTEYCTTITSNDHFTPDKGSDLKKIVLIR